MMWDSSRKSHLNEVYHYQFKLYQVHQYQYQMKLVTNCLDNGMFVILNSMLTKKTSLYVLYCELVKSPIFTTDYSIVIAQLESLDINITNL